jgi:hypothetical protein
VGRGISSVAVEEMTNEPLWLVVGDKLYKAPDVTAERLPSLESGLTCGIYANCPPLLPSPNGKEQSSEPMLQTGRNMSLQ